MAYAANQPAPTDATESRRIKFYRAFKELAGEDNEIDAWELQEVLGAVMERDHWDIGRFTLESCKSMIAMSDADRSGKLGFEEFLELWRSICAWKDVFNTFDRDNSGTFSARELHLALTAVGYKLNHQIFRALVLRYSDKNSQISFDSFIACATKLRHMFHVFNKYRGYDTNATFQLDEYLITTIYS